MERLPNESLENAISVYKTTIEAVEKYGDTDYDLTTLDKVTVAFLEELKEYRAIGTVEDIEKGIKQSEEEFEMLKAYRDAEEQGLLFSFPFKVGDTIWFVINGELSEHRVSCIELHIQRVLFEARENDTGIYRHFYANKIGKTVFLTKEAAEQALKEMEK